MENKPLTSEKIIDSLLDKMKWSTQTIKTFITRLIKKGAIGFEKLDNSNEVVAEFINSKPID